ncbi:MAG TPA: homocysteine S-methyltransferase [Acidobacteriaceae bacterium]|nr:homocysteine S-methyltransferase [Acidobacteriaceae bacterium]
MTPHDSIDFLSVRVLDGAMATELERRGCDISGPLWSAHVLDESPAAISAVHLDYLRAGADCISTASYQVSVWGYRELGRSPGDAAHALRQSVAIAEQVRSDYAREDPRRIWIAASLGPYGAALHNGAEYHGRYSIEFDDLVAFHAERLAVLAETGADFVALETIPSLDEAYAILRALEQTPSVSAWISFTCRDAFHVAHGELLEDCAAAVASAPQVLAVGINCTAPHHIASLIAEARCGARGQKPVIVYPNSGETWDPVTRSWRGDADTARFSALARAWFAAGAQAVGGCCRTGPAHIAAVARARRAANPAAPP